MNELLQNQEQSGHTWHHFHKHNSQQRKAHEPSKAEENYVQIQNIILVAIDTRLCEIKKTAKSQHLKTEDH